MPYRTHVLLWYIYHPIRVVNKVITTWLWLLRVLESQHPMMTMLFIPCENIRVSSIMKLTMWWCVKSHGNYHVILPGLVAFIASVYHRQPWSKRCYFCEGSYASLMLSFFLSNTVRRRISESQLSEIAYYPAIKTRERCDWRKLTYCSQYWIKLNENLRYLSVW